LKHSRYSTFRKKIWGYFIFYEHNLWTFLTKQKGNSLNLRIYKTGQTVSLFKINELLNEDIR